LTINSGYRLRGLTGGESPTSDHPKGRAFDIGTMPKTGDFQQFKRNYDLIIQLEKILPYDQLILEYPDEFGTPSWVHVSWESTGKQRKQILIATRENGSPKYYPFTLENYKKVCPKMK
jgi:hypothetical protein